MTTKSQPLTCKCGVVFGRSYEVDGVFVGAQIGTLIVDELHSKCAQCGRGVHVVVSRKALLKLLSHYTDVVSALEVEISE